MMPDQDPLYLDYNATTPILPEVVDAMIPYLRDHFGNPSSSHVYGQRARAGLERARAQVAALLGCTPAEVIFTSGGTESNNLAIGGACQARPNRRRVITSKIEHPATAKPCAWLAEHGYEVHEAGVDEHGVILCHEVEAALDERVALVSVMLANNETGSIQPIERLARYAHEHGALLHTDAAQAVGKVPVDVHALGVDLLSVAGHKLYAPKGVGALFIRQGIPHTPVLLGAGHERGVRPGTENIASIVGLGHACEVAMRTLEAERARQVKLRDGLHEALRAAIPGLELNGHPTLRLPNTLNVRFPQVSGAALLAGAPQLCASVGSACHEGQVKASAVILAMGVDAQQALGSVRLSLGRMTTQAQLEQAAAALIAAWRRLCL